MSGLASKTEDGTAHPGPIQTSTHTKTKAKDCTSTAHLLKERADAETHRCSHNADMTCACEQLSSALNCTKHCKELKSAMHARLRICVRTVCMAERARLCMCAGSVRCSRACAHELVCMEYASMAACSCLPACAAHSPGAQTRACSMLVLPSCRSHSCLWALR